MGVAAWKPGEFRDIALLGYACQQQVHAGSVLGPVSCRGLVVVALVGRPRQLDWIEDLANMRRGEAEPLSRISISIDLEVVPGALFLHVRSEFFQAQQFQGVQEVLSRA